MRNETTLYLLSFVLYLKCFLSSLILLSRVKLKPEPVNLVECFNIQNISSFYFQATFNLCSMFIKKIYIYRSKHKQKNLEFFFKPGTSEHLTLFIPFRSHTYYKRYKLKLMVLQYDVFGFPSHGFC